MELVKKGLSWNNPVIRRLDNAWLSLIIGLVLIITLTYLTGFNPLLGIACALVLFLLALVVPRPALIVYGLVLILPLTDGIARGAVVPILRLGQALLVLGFILFLLTRPSALGKSRLTAIDLAFVLFFLSEAIFPVLALYARGEHLNLTSPGPYGTSAPIQTLLGPLQYYLVYRIAVATITSETKITIVLKLSFLASIVVSVMGILEQFLAPVHTFIQTYYPSIVMTNTGPVYPARITSTMQAYTALASYLTATLIVALACGTVRKGLKISPLLLATTLLLDSMALLLTGTFASFFGLAIGAGVVFILFRRLPKWISIALAGIALSGLIFQSFFSARLAFWLGGNGQEMFPTFNYRIMLWKDVFLPAVSQHLLFGAGPAPEALTIWPTEETQYLGLLLRGGLPNFFSYFLLMGVAIATCWRRIKNKSNDLVHTVAIATLAILVAINFMNVSSLYFTYPGITQTLFMLLAVIVASEQLEVQGSPLAIEQTGKDREKVRVRTSHEPLNETPAIIVDKRGRRPADEEKTSPYHLYPKNLHIQKYPTSRKGTEA
jgi:O-antigen ligase